MKYTLSAPCCDGVNTGLHIGNRFSAENGLVKPNQLIFDKALSAKQIAANESVARKYATFWDTGKEALARDALAEDFIDKTPPEGRKQGPDGAIMASGVSHGGTGFTL